MSAPDPSGTSGLDDDQSLSDSGSLRSAYTRQGQALYRWVLGGILLLLALLGLWWKGPRTTWVFRATTYDYSWRQCGTIQANDTTWAWVLADSVGQAQLLLSSTQGRMWQVHKLGLPTSQVLALAPGWRGAWDALLLGSNDTVYHLVDFRRTPRFRQALLAAPKGALDLAIDSAQKQVVVAALDSTDKLWRTTLTGSQWSGWQEYYPHGKPPRATANLLADTSITRVAYNASRQRFVAASRVGVWEQLTNSASWRRISSFQDRPLAAPLVYVGPWQDDQLAVIGQQDQYRTMLLSLQLIGVRQNGRVVMGGPFFRDAEDWARTEAHPLGDFRGSNVRGITNWTRKMLGPGDSILLFSDEYPGGAISRFRVPASIPVSDSESATSTSAETEPLQAQTKR